MSPVKLGIEDESFARMDAALQKAEALKKKGTRCVNVSSLLSLFLFYRWEYYIRF